MKIMISNMEHKNLAQITGDDHLKLIYEDSYNKGDYITFEAEANEFVNIHVDPNIAESVVYLPEGKMSYSIPFDQAAAAYHPETFIGSSHMITMTKVNDDVLSTRRNLALNGLDKRGDINYYPHTDANIVTRDEPWFESRNAVDGFKDTKGHGPFPFQSWGGGLRDDLEFRLFFGREVIVDEIIIYLRADYKDDHDINWESGVIEFSDGYTMPIKMTKTVEGQSFKIEKRKVSWIKLHHLRREISAAFSALIQIEVFGVEEQ